MSLFRKKSKDVKEAEQFAKPFLVALTLVVALAFAALRGVANSMS